MIATSQPTPLDKWRQRLGGRHRRAEPRPLAALGYLTDGQVIDGLIAVEKLIFVLLHDELIRPRQCALRLAGYSGSRVPWGVRFGGRSNCRFVKDLMLQPVPDGEGYRLDAADEELITVGVQLDRELSSRRLRLRERPLLPKLWAGFSPAKAASITGDGPELAAYAARVGKPAECLFQQLRRDHQSLSLHPLAWVSHHWQQAVTIFADLTCFPERQVLRVQQQDDLAGYYGAAEFNFSRPCNKHRRLRQSPVSAAA